MNRLFLLAAALLVAAAPAGAAYEIRIATDAEDWHAAIGQTVTYRVSLLEDGRPVVGQKLQYTLSWDYIVPIRKGEITSAAEPVELTGLATHPGFMRLDVHYQPAEGKAVDEPASVAVAPRQIHSPVTEPDDFDAFWESKKQLVLAEPMNPQLTPVDSQMENFEIFDLQINCPGVKPCSGYFGRPTNAKPGTLPAVLFVHSAGVWSSWINAVRQAGRWGDVLAYDLNAHGIPNGHDRPFYEALDAGELKGYPFQGIEDRETDYFLGMYMRIIRAIQFLTSQPEWDGKNLVVIGGSQGGGQAIVAAGLDPRVTLVLVRLPALANQTGFLAGQPAGWPRTVFRGNVEYCPINEYDEQVADVSRYFDAVNFARRCHAEIVIAVGFVDHTCPPTSIYGMFNAMPSEHKTIIDFPRVGHFHNTKPVEERMQRVAEECIQRLCEPAAGQ